MTTLSNLQRRLRTKLHDRVAKGILNTPPISYEKSNDVVILSLLGHQGVNMYLVAIKSFLSSLGYGTVEVVSDGTLTDRDIQTIKTHIPAARVTFASDVSVGACPTGGCWERLIRILELSQTQYVIQLDSDTITSGPVPDVHKAIQSGNSFCIGNPIWQEPVDISYLSRLARRWRSDHVQVLAEQGFTEIASVSGMAYCRGSAGFSGFPAGNPGVARLQEFSQEMQDLLGEEKWSEWGSEQVASNVIVSLSKGAHVLPWPTYQNFKFPPSGQPVERAAFFHFLGTHRYDSGVYTRLTKRVINNMS